jgi:hypothetical protein
MAQAHHTVEAPTSVFFRLSQRPPPTAAAVAHVSSSVPASLSALDACSEQAEPVATDLDNAPAQPDTDGSEQSVEFPASADAARLHELARRSSFASADQLHECFLAHAADGRMDEPSAVAVLAKMFGSRAGGGRTGPVAARSSCGAADERLAAPVVSRREAMRSWLAQRYFRLIDVGKVSERRAAVRAACLTGASPSLHFDTARLYFRAALASGRAVQRLQRKSVTEVEWIGGLLRLRGGRDELISLLFDLYDCRGVQSVCVDGLLDCCVRADDPWRPLFAQVTRRSRFSAARCDAPIAPVHACQ